ncbi:hypothetical protein F511_37774 [Dorcoceras hygrometricum]|uniref:Uncharacterized protein n=1 Tax=Dorcoceras hygrometricum TaxID=472368 RepID=A0A2Z7D8H1_9LAMI|nr:hypothetical protein F511_37774 [Dorcoceras hygrometricum]
MFDSLGRQFNHTSRGVGSPMSVGSTHGSRRSRIDDKKEDRYNRDDKSDERAVDRSKERSKDRWMRTRGDKRSSRKHDRKVLVAEESTKIWADTDSESSSSSSSSSDSEQEEVHCLMADQTSDDEVFDFSNVEFTREDLVSALNDMVKEYRKLSHSFEEIKAENISLKNSSIESSSEELEDIDSLKIELSKLMIENDLLRNESSELKAEVERLTKEMSSWNQSARALHKLHESQKSVYDRTGLGFSSSESSEGETSTQSQLVYDKFNKMSFVKANMIYDCYESITFDDQNSPKLNENGKTSVTPSDTDEEVETMDVGTDGGDQQVQTFVEELEDEEMSGDDEQSVAEMIDADEAMSLEDILYSIPVDVPLPSAGVEITKITLGKEIKIPGVDERTWYLASLPQIPVDDKGKEPLMQKDQIKGKPPQEHYSLICADIDLLVQLHAQVIDEVEKFFNSFSLKKLATLQIDESYFEKEALVLSWAEAVSTRIALNRKVYILMKYREVLVRKFLESWKLNFVPGEGSSATDLKVIYMLSDLHLFILEELKQQTLAHGLRWDRTLFSRLSTADITDFVASIASARTVLRSVQITSSSAVSQYIPSVADTEFVAQRVPMELDQRPFLSSISDAPDMHFDETDIAAIVPSLPAITTDLSASLDDLQTFLSERINESQSDILSKLHTIERAFVIPCSSKMNISEL